YLNRTGSTIVVMTVLVLSAGLATQLSIGRAFSLAGASVRERGTGLAVRFRSWRDERRREKQRADVIRKHTEKAGPDKAADVAKAATMAASLKASLKSRKPEAPKAAADIDDEDDEVDVRPAPKAALRAPAIKRVAPAEQPLPLPEPEPKAPAERRKGAYTLPPLSLLDPARSERKIDERELMEAARLLEEKCREFNVEG